MIYDTEIQAWLLIRREIHITALIIDLEQLIERFAMCGGIVFEMSSRRILYLSYNFCNHI